MRSSSPLENIPSGERMSRRSAITLGTAGLLAALPASYRALMEAGKPKCPHHGPETVATIEFDLEKIGELLYSDGYKPVIRRESWEEKGPQFVEQSPSSTRPEESQIGFKSIWEYITHFRLSEREIQEAHHPAIYCVSWSNAACDTLWHKRIHMYLISVWPKFEDQRYKESWHTFSAFRTGEHDYVFIDRSNTEILQWHGRLCDYIDRYDQMHKNHSPKNLIPGIGICRYRPTAHDTPLAKALQHCYDAQGTNEQEMEITRFPSSSGQMA